MQIDIGRNIAYITSIKSKSISQHAWSRNFNWIRPVVIIIAKCIGKIQYRVFSKLWCILSYIKVGRFNSSLGCRMRNKEKIKLPINHFRLFNKALINISTLRWIQDLLPSFLKEALFHSFVNNDKSNVRSECLSSSWSLFFKDSLSKLF